MIVDKAFDKAWKVLCPTCGQILMLFFRTQCHECDMKLKKDVELKSKENENIYICP